MNMKYIIGIDIGTSGTKSALFDEDGRLVASAFAEYPLYQPHNGWAEQNPDDWWTAVCKTLKQLTADLSDAEIVGVGLSGQMHSLVLLDKDDNVIRPAILWCDQRTGAQCAKIENIIGKERLVEITANPALPGFTASKLVWVKDNEPENYAITARILLAKDYIRFKLTGEYATDLSDASGMQLLNVADRCWSKEVCDKLGIDMSALGKLYESPEVSGRISEKASSLTGVRSVQKALLFALLQPNEKMKSLQNENNFTELMVLSEELKLAPVGDVWNEFLKRENVSPDYLGEVLKYEKKVLVNRK